MTQSPCPTCGAPLAGPGLPCRYCAAGLPGAVSLTGLAAGLSASADALARGLPLLAEELNDALPGRVRIEHGGLLGSGKAIRSLTVDLGESVFTITVQHGSSAAVIGHQHSGVVLRHDEVTTAEWLRQLSIAINDHAARESATAPALQRLLGPQAGQ